MTQLVMYTTSHCHLCEQAEAMLTSLQKLYNISWEPVEISENEHLIQRYGTRIPVIKRLDNQRELDWPFTENNIISLIKA